MIHRSEVMPGGEPRCAKVSFRFSLAHDLPPLAWLIRLDHKSYIASVTHGKGVETSDYGFVEGGWAGDFSQMRFDRAFMTGTGARLQGGKLLLVTPSHTLDRICLVRKGGVTFASNSLPFVLVGSGEHLADDFLFYDSYVASIRHGLNKYERTIPTKSGNRVQLHYCENIVLDGNGEFRVESKIASPTFPNYDSYRSYLDSTIRTIAANASDTNRKVRYLPMGTISQGYDSPTASVLARVVGCTHVVTFRESRRGPAGEDCGTEIARKLGLHVKEFGRLDYRDSHDFPEIFSSGGPSEFLSFGEELRGTLLFTGFNGDMIWNKNANPISNDLVRTDASGTSLTEYRINTGFIHLPVPFIGADSHASIYAISNSREMADWAIGGTYDRPIARRIVEEAGIPRDMFGRKKRAAGVVVTAEGLDVTMSETSLQDFKHFVMGRWNTKKSLVMIGVRATRRIVRYNEFAKRIGARILRPLGIRGSGVPDFVPHKLRMLSFGYLGLESMLFHWGVDKLQERYQAAISAKC
jgi:hypothetical protein